MIHRIFAAAALAASFVLPVAAQQQQPTGFHNIACVKARPGQASNFREFLQGDVQKYAQARVSSGAIAAFMVLRAIMPAGSDGQCDYAIVTFYNGAPPAPMSHEDLLAALQKAGVDPQQYLQKRSEMTELVSTHLTQYQVLVGAAKKGDYLVFNSMHAKDVDAWVAWEKKNWQPFAEAAVKQGLLSAWAINVQIFPTGESDHDLVSSVDVYPTWNAVFNQSQTYRDAWTKTHPGVDPAAFFADAGKLRTIEHTALYQVDDMIAAPTRAAR